MRTAIAAATCALLVVLCAWQHLSAPAEVQRARALSGERWYRLSLNDEHLGYWRTRAYRNPAGEWVFESEQRFAISATDPVTVTSRRVYAAIPPYSLVAAQQRRQRRGWWEYTVIDRQPGSYRGRLMQGDGAGPAAVSLEQDRVSGNHETSPTPMALDLHYSLGDYLDYEVWLHQEQPAVGSTRTIRTLDFSRIDVVPRKLAVSGRNATGYQIENPAPYSATTIQLDADYAPTRIRLAGLFDLKLTSRTRALAPRSSLQSASYYIRVDRPLPDHTRAQQVQLRVNSSEPADQLWPQSEWRDGVWVLTLTANPLSGQPGPGTTSAAPGFPANHPDIRRLMKQATRGLDQPQDKIAALTKFVHNFINYQPGAAAQPVLALLDNPIGDCTEYADLLTTLARSAGLPARTVFGLAYSDRNKPAFVFHAWNEVRIDGSWQPVDPTWNQLQVDATHLPLPADEVAALKLLTGAVDVSFELDSLDYFSDG